MVPLELYWLGRQPYAPIQSKQRELAGLRRSDDIPDQLLLLEHDPVITYGKPDNGKFITSETHQLAQQGVTIAHSDRGGEITYHGPGQLVCYPILKLREKEQDLHLYLRNLEQVAIDLLSSYGIEGSRIEAHTGVWIGHNKIQAIGIRARTWVTSHGFSFNVHKITGFQHIIPCGIPNSGVTSLEELGIQTDVTSVAQRVATIFQKIFKRRGVWVRTS